MVSFPILRYGVSSGHGVGSEYPYHARAPDLSVPESKGTRFQMPVKQLLRSIILFDGVCNLCNSAVQWVIERDKEGRFDFASLQSQAARRELESVIGPEEIAALPDSIVLVDSDGVHTRSAAALRIVRALGSPFALLSLGVVVPRPIRDAVYDWIARNRYRWFGRRDTCMTPTPDLAARFLDANEPPGALQKP